MKKKIALLLSTKPLEGGQHQYAVMVVKCLLEEMQKDYELVVLSGNSFWRKWCKERGISYLGYSLPAFSMREKQFNYRFPLLAKLYYTYMTFFGRKIREEKIDILFSLHQGIFMPNYKAKLVSPVHDLMHRYEAEFPEVQSSYADREIAMKCLARYAACVFVDSNLGKKQFEESYMQVYKKPRVVRLPFVVPDHVWEIKEKYIETPNKYVFYPAQFWKHKNHINLVKAIRILKETISDIHLILVGSEKNSYKEIRRYIRKNNLQENITILGFVSDENIVYLYKHAVGLIMPSYFGPTNIPPLEAMALGCPVVVSNKYAMAEQVGTAGLLFDPDSPREIADCIQRLWFDDDLRHKMQMRGYKRVQRWTKREFGSRLCKTLNEI